MANLERPRPTLWRLEDVPPERIWSIGPLPNTWLLLPWEISWIVQAVWPQYTHVPDRQTNDDKSLTLGYRPTRDRRISTRGQIVVKKICAAVKVAVKQLTTGCDDVDSGRHNVAFYPNSLQVTPMHRAIPLQKDPAIARSLYSNTTSDVRGRSLRGGILYI